jgi:hypothetical protein
VSDACLKIEIALAETDAPDFLAAFHMAGSKSLPTFAPGIITAWLADFRLARLKLERPIAFPIPDAESADSKQIPHWRYAPEEKPHKRNPRNGGREAGTSSYPSGRF